MAKTPKTGTAKRLRDWMKQQKKPFSMSQACDELDLEGDARYRHRNAARDFILRNEIIAIGGGLYQYNHDWKPAGKKSDKGTMRRKVIKAIYVSVTGFTIRELQFLTGMISRDYIRHIVRELKNRGYVRKESRLILVEGGHEFRYRMTNRKRFNMDLM